MKLYRLTATHKDGGEFARFSPFAGGILDMEAVALRRRGWEVSIDPVEVNVNESGHICGGDWPNASNTRIANLVNAREREGS